MNEELKNEVLAAADLYRMGWPLPAENMGALLIRLATELRKHSPNSKRNQLAEDLVRRNGCRKIWNDSLSTYRATNRLQAIRDYRSATGAGLEEAQDAIEAACDHLLGTDHTSTSGTPKEQIK